MKTRITTYTFDASAKTITFSGTLDIEGFTVINNVVDNVIIYNFNDPLKGGTFLTNTLTLTYDTSSMSDTDELMILYEDGINTQVVSGTVTANAGTNLNTSALALEAGGNLAAIKTNTDDIEALLTTIEGNQLPDGHNVTIDNVSIDVDTGLTQPLTNTELRAAAVPVSGTVTANTGLDLSGLATSAKQDTIITDTGNIVTDIGTLAGSVSGSEMQVDVVAALPGGANIIGKFGHDITGIGHGVKTVTTAGTDEALAGSTVCKSVTIQAQTDNTLPIAVGGVGVDATIDTGTGILLYPGDIYEFYIVDLADVYIDSLVDGEGVRFTYFT